MERVFAEVEVSYSDGSIKNVTMECKLISEIRESEKGKIILLVEKNGDNLTGIFEGVIDVMEDDGDETENILISSINSKTNSIGVPVLLLEDFYFEEFDEEMPKGKATVIENLEE